MVHQFVSPLFSYANEHWHSENKNTVWANVVFGQPSLACHGNGLCRVDLDTAMGQLNPTVSDSYGEACERISVLMSNGEQEGLKIVVPSQEVSSRTYYQQFSEPFFRMEESFCFSKEITEALELSNRLLGKGLYEMTKTKDLIILYLSRRLAW